jgi:hypothetical protein
MQMEEKTKGPARSKRHGGYWRPFEEAREFARSLGLESGEDWKRYSRSGERPADIPSRPNYFYGERWIDWADWLGSKHRRGDWRPFEDAREYARGLGLKNTQDWQNFCRSGQKPHDIPTTPDRVYKDSGWRGLSDWLGVDSSRNRPPENGWRPFEEAREYMHSLGLKSWNDWAAYSTSGQKPRDIPSAPGRVYRDAGWIGLGDWLGTGSVAPKDYTWQPFEEAREYVRSLGLATALDYGAWSRSRERPKDIPSAPWQVYANVWEGWGDFLGTGNVHKGAWRPFEEARDYIRQMGFSGEGEWRVWASSGKRPPDIPSDPAGVYKDDGWVSWGDWVGTGYIATRKRQYKSYEEARAFVRTLGLKNGREWKTYLRSGQKPDDIPANPWQVYGPKWKRR